MMAMSERDDLDLAALADEVGRDHLALGALLADLERLAAAAEAAEAALAAHVRGHCRLIRKHGDVNRTRWLLGRGPAYPPAGKHDG